MTVQSRPLSPVRAEGVESHLRARVERLRTRPTPLGICRSCRSIVHSGDSLGDVRWLSLPRRLPRRAGRIAHRLTGRSLRVDVDREGDRAVRAVA